MWIASVVNIDWPSVPGLTAAAQKAELVALYDLAVARGMNTVVLQVRPTADAFWPSPYEPWSMYLTGTQGQDPGYDPPDFAVHAARTQPVVARMVQSLPRQYGHRRRRAAPDASGAGTPGLGHPLRREALLRPGCPGHPRILRDPYATYGAGFADKASWRRHNVDTLIRELVVGIRRVGSRVQFGVSPFAVWRNIVTDPRGSDTQAGAQTYDDLFADTRRWVREEWIDYIAPQVYWVIGLPVADYAKVVDWWARQLRESGSRVRLYIGEATYKAGASTQSPAWDNDPSELSNHLALERGYPEVDEHRSLPVRGAGRQLDRRHGRFRAALRVRGAGRRPPRERERTGPHPSVNR